MCQQKFTVKQTKNKITFDVKVKKMPTAENYTERENGM